RSPARPASTRSVTAWTSSDCARAAPSGLLPAARLSDERGQTRRVGGIGAADLLVVHQHGRRAGHTALGCDVGVLRHPSREPARAHTARKRGIGDPYRAAETQEPLVREEAGVLGG